MKVGDKVWLFDHNRRVYPKDKGLGCRPIYSEHFYQSVIEGETTRSWVVDGQKYNKNYKNGRDMGLYTDEDKEAAIWDYDNRRKVIEVVERCSIEDLKKIYNLLIKG